MGNQQKWIEVIKKLPAWLSGGISLTTALIGFVLLLQGNHDLGLTILGILVTSLLLFFFAYIAFTKTTPLIEGGRGVYRFENYRPWALLGFGLIVGIVISALLVEQSRLFLITAITEREIPTNVPGETTSDSILDPPTDTQEATTVSTTPGTCFEEYYSSVPEDRVYPLEIGAPVQVVIDRTQTKEGVAGLQFTDFGQSIGAMKYHIYPDNELFRIESLVNGDCQELEEYFGKSVHGGDAFQIRLDDDEYILVFSYDGGAVYATFEQVVP